MLSLQPVNFVNRSLTFRGDIENNEQPRFDRREYNEQRATLEQNQQEVNDLINNDSIPKPIRKLGKLVSIVITGALGFISMKFGAEGILSCSKKLLKRVQPKAQKFAEKIVKPVKSFVTDKLNKLVEMIKNTKVYNQVAEKLAKAKDSFLEKPFGKRVQNLWNKFKSSNFVKYIKSKFEAMKSWFSDKANVENVAVNSTAVAGGGAAVINSVVPNSEEVSEE